MTVCGVKSFGNPQTTGYNTNVNGQGKDNSVLANKIGIVLLNLGGPDSLKAVKPFLYNLFSDPDIIKLPLSEIFQKPLAWTISTLRGPEAAENYHQIGGRSPILPLTQSQADAMQQQLRDHGLNLPVYIAMRYWHPFTDAVVDQIIKDGIDHLIVLPLYPHFSYTTTGSSVNELERVLTRRGSRINTVVVPPYYQHPDYLAALAETITDGLAAYPDWSVPPHDVTIMFSAHSLPRRHVKRTEDPYPQQIYDCADAIMRQFFPQNPWELGFQSKVGRMAWLGPQTDGLLHYFAATHVDNVLVVPISFVSDHVETLFELDIDYIPLGREIGIPHVQRAPSLNSRPSFIHALTQLVLEQLTPLGLNTQCTIDAMAL
jgi:protoporphyrin/coproporphyrin ferrochelatase